MAYLVGATVIAGTSAYFAMPKEARKNLRDMISNLSSKKDGNSDNKSSN